MAQVQVNDFADFGVIAPFGGATVTLDSNATVTTREVMLPAGVTNYDIAVSVTIASVKAIAIYANAANVVVKTNSTSAPDETINLTAKEPLIWTNKKPSGSRFITHNITHLYVTTGAAAAKFQFGVAV